MIEMTIDIKTEHMTLKIKGDRSTLFSETLVFTERMLTKLSENAPKELVFLAFSGALQDSFLNLSEDDKVNSQTVIDLGAIEKLRGDKS